MTTLDPLNPNTDVYDLYMFMREEGHPHIEHTINLTNVSIEEVIAYFSNPENAKLGISNIRVLDLDSSIYEDDGSQSTIIRAITPASENETYFVIFFVIGSSGENDIYVHTEVYFEGSNRYDLQRINHSMRTMMVSLYQGKVVRALQQVQNLI